MEEFKPNNTDNTVIRQLTLLNLFNNNPKGLSFEKVNKLIYQEYATATEDSIRQMFYRDREILADVLGFYTYHNNQTNMFEVDWERTRTAGGSDILTKAEKIVIRELTLPRLIESYADQSDLIIALNKIGVPLNHARKVLPSDAGSIDFLKGSLSIKYVIWNCYMTRTPCLLSYITADGSMREYTACIYGTFSIGENRYIVVNIGQDELRTLRCDRIEEIRPLSGSEHYEIPQDYQNQDYIKLPFQIGPKLFDATVHIDKNCVEEFNSVQGGKGEVRKLENGDLEWTVSVSDEDVFLFWLISYGFIPTAPESLKESFIQRLERMAEDEKR